VVWGITTMKIIIDGGECLVGEEGDCNVYAHTRNHSVVSLATDEIVLNVFGINLFLVYNFQKEKTQNGKKC